MTPTGRPSAADFRTHALPAWIRAESGGVRLSLRVQPGARRCAVIGPHGDRLKVAVQAPPVDGRANEALLRYLGACLDVRLAALELVAGGGSRDKAVSIRCDPAQAQAFAERLAALAG